MCDICDPKAKYNNCICSKDWKTFNETLTNIKNVSSNLLVEDLRISTITLCCNFNSKINCEQLVLKYPPKTNGKFYNSYIFNWHTKYQQKTVVSIKIFPNGKSQITGLKNIKSCAYIIRKIYNKLNNFLLDKNHHISDIKIAMINSDFKILGTLNLLKLCNVLSDFNIQNNGNFINVVYQPIKYPAINSKFIVNRHLPDYFKHIYQYGLKKKYSNNISILIFRSGSIIITGGNNIDDYLFTYQYLINLIEKNNNKIII